MKINFKNFYKNKFIFNSLWVSSIGILVGILNYFFQIITSRFLTENDYVIFVAFMGIYAFCTAPTAGFALIISRSVSKIISEKKEEYLTTNYFQFLKYIFFSSIFFFIFLFLFKKNIISYFEIPDSQLLLFLFILFFFHLITTLNNSFFLGLQKFILFGIFNLNIALIKNIANLIFLFLSFGILSSILSIITSFVIILILSLYFLKDNLIFGKIENSLENNYSFFDKTWLPIILSNIGLGLMTQLDVAIAKLIFYENDALHKFASASVIAKSVLYLSGGIAISTFPQMTEDSFQQNSKNNLFKKSILLSMIISAICVIFFYFFGEFLINFFFGERYLGSEKFLFIYSIALIPMSLLLILEHYIMAQGKTLIIWILILIAPLHIFVTYKFSENFYHIMFFTFAFSTLVLLIGLLILKKKYDSKNN